MVEVTIRRWDPAEHLIDALDAEAYLAAALDIGDPQLIEAVLDDIARAGLSATTATTVAAEAGYGSGRPQTG